MARSHRSSPTRTGRSSRRIRSPPGSTTRASAPSTRCCATAAGPATSPITDSDALLAFRELSRLEGIIPALESSHAIAWLLGEGREGAGELDVVTLSGRGDKDLAEALAGLERARDGERWLRRGIERIAAAFAARAAEGRAALMPYLMGGFPDMPTSAAVIDAYADTGADLIELGVPYSDPLADGPQIHAAATTALEAGARFDGVMELCERVSARVPVLPMVYANVVLTLGAERFAAALEGAGAAGAIIPDLPRSEDPSVADGAARRGGWPRSGSSRRRRRPSGSREIAARRRRLHLRRLARPASPASARSCRPSSGRWSRPSGTASDAPAAVGFGIGTPEQAAQVGEIADGVIIGTRLVRAVADAADGRARPSTRSPRSWRTPGSPCRFRADAAARSSRQSPCSPS